MTQQPSNQGRAPRAKQQPGHDESTGSGFDPSGPHGGFGGAGGSQGSLYGEGPGTSHQGPSKQRLEHEAWERAQTQAGLHGGVVPGEKGPYGDYGEVQGHRHGYWYGGEASDAPTRADPSKRSDNRTKGQ